MKAKENIHHTIYNHKHIVDLGESLMQCLSYFVGKFVLLPADNNNYCRHWNSLNKVMLEIISGVSFASQQMSRTEHACWAR